MIFIERSHCFGAQHAIVKNDFVQAALKVLPQRDGADLRTGNCFRATRNVDAVDIDGNLNRGVGIMATGDLIQRHQHMIPLVGQQGGGKVSNGIKATVVVIAGFHPQRAGIWLDKEVDRPTLPEELRRVLLLRGFDPHPDADLARIAHLPSEVGGEQVVAVKDGGFPHLSLCAGNGTGGANTSGRQADGAVIRECRRREVFVQMQVEQRCFVHNAGNLGWGQRGFDDDQMIDQAVEVVAGP